MLRLKDLKNRVYSGKTCIRFEYEIQLREDETLTVFFKKENKPETEWWNMQIIFDRTRDKDSEMYNFKYIMPRSGLPLELIAATGLRYLKLHLEEEMQTKTNLVFEIGRVTEGM